MKSTVGTHVTFYEFQVNNALMDLIKATKSAIKPEEWSAQPENTSGKLKKTNTSYFSWRQIVPEQISYAASSSETGALISVRPIAVTVRTDAGVDVTAAVYNLLGKLQLSFLYLIGMIVMGFEHMRNIVRVMKPVRVAAIESCKS
jgi:hypothetical protein